MQTAEEVLDAYYLDVRCMLIEIAATLDRYDTAAAREAKTEDDNPRLKLLYQALDKLVDRKAEPDRAEQLLLMFSDPVD